MKNEAVAVKPIRTLEDALNRCQSLGMRLSRQRRFILELLWQAKEHLSAREIYDRLNQQGKAIGHTSVYQNLEALSERGIVECVERSEGRLYGNISDPHSHIHCLDTERIVDVYVELPKDLIEKLEQQTGVKITDYRIDFYGTEIAPAPELEGGAAGGAAGSAPGALRAAEPAPPPNSPSANGSSSGRHPSGTQVPDPTCVSP
jgi:Fur family ferric uptake transcriptional regulator